VYLIPAGLRLGSGNDAPFTQFYVHFDVIGLPHIALEELFGGPVRVPSSPQFRDSVAGIGARGPGSGADPLVDQCLVKGIVYEALGRYLREAPAEQRERWGLRLSRLKPVLPAIQKIDENPGAKIVVKDLAAVCHMSEDHFIRRFHACAGLSPMQYVMDRRVSLAAQRLLFTEESLEQIASVAGFGNRYYFTRVFTRHTGQPPAAFRKGVR
jgi:AraC-like DNA-binding protein